MNAPAIGTDNPLAEDELLTAYNLSRERIARGFPAGEPIPPLVGPDHSTLATMAFQNALSLYRSALEIAALEEYGHATALLVLSLEEAGKALMLRFLAFEVFTTDPAARGARPYVEERALWCHQCKQQITAALALGGHFLPLLGFDDAWFEDRASKVSDDELVAHPEKLLEVIPQMDASTKDAILAALKANPNEVLPLRETFLFFGGVNRTKLRGLYVDFDGGFATSPRGIGRKEYEDFAARVRLLVGPIIPFAGGQPPPEIARAVLTALKNAPLPPVQIVCRHSRRQPTKPA